MLSLPIITLIFWSLALIVKDKENGALPRAGICVFCIGLFFYLFILLILRLKWNKFSFDVFSAIYFFTGLCCLMIHLFLVIFMDDSPSNFGISCVFLMANLVIMVLIVYVNTAVRGGSIDDLIKKKMSEI